MVRWLDQEEQRTWRSFLAATRLLFDQLERELQREMGVPLIYYELLAELSEAPGNAMRMSDLADSAQASRSRLSHAMARMEEAGWIRRENCPSDRRGWNAVLTEEGLAALEAAAPVHVTGVREHLFDQLDPEQVAELRRISESLLAHLEQLGLSCPASGSEGAQQAPPAQPMAGAGHPEGLL